MQARVTGSGRTIAEALQNAQEIAATGFEVTAEQVRVVPDGAAWPDIVELRDGTNTLRDVTVTWYVTCICDVPVPPE